MRRITVSDYTLKELCTKDGSQLLFREKLSVALSISRFGADCIELPPVKKAKEDLGLPVSVTGDEIMEEESQETVEEAAE